MTIISGFKKLSSSPEKSGAENVMGFESFAVTID